MASLQTIDDAFSVLEYLAGNAAPQALSRISRDLNMSKPRMHRILGTLVSRGYATRDPESALYGFGAMCGSLIAQARSGVSLGQACAAPLRRLWERTGETSYLAVLESDRAIVVDKLDSQQAVIATSVLGRALPLHGVSAGKALLASRPDHEIDALIARSIAAYPEARPRDPARVWAELRRTRAQGYADNAGGFRDSVGGFAAPVRWSNNGPAAAAIAVCLPRTRLRAVSDELRRAVLTAAQEATSALGAAVDAGIGAPATRARTIGARA